MIRTLIGLVALLGSVTVSLGEDGYFSSVEREKWILALFKENPGWVMLQADGDHSRAYFPILVKARCAVTEVRYSVNSDALDRAFALLPCTERTPAALPESNVTVSTYAADLPAPLAETISVQVTFTDGSMSDVVTYAACALDDRKVCSRLVD